MKNNIIENFFITLALSIISLSIIGVGVVYYIQKTKFDNSIVSEMTQHIDRGIKGKDFSISSKHFIKHVKMLNFIFLKVYDKNGKIVYSFSQEKRLDNKIKEHLSKKIDDFSKISNVHFNLFETSQRKLHILIVYPIYKNNTLLGYIKGIKRVDSSVVEIFKQKVIDTLFIIFASLFIFSLLIFPIIYVAYKNLNQNRIDLISNNIKTINVLGNAIALRDSDTNEHNYRVTLYAFALAKELNLKIQDIQNLIIGAFLHDVGKIGISDSILLKNGKLTEKEFEIMKEHVNKGVLLIKGNQWLQRGKDVILNHHEKYDGSGYPNQIAKDNIPLIARIFAIVDVFDALTSKRPYKEPFSYEKTMDILDESKGSHFDAVILEVFVKISYELYVDIRKDSQQDLQNKLKKIIKDNFLNWKYME